MTHSRNIHSEANKTANEYLAGWQRARAELVNFRKREAARQQELYVQNVRAIIEPLLSLNDNFRVMVEHVPAGLQDNAWVQGALHIARQLQDILTEFNVEVLEPTGAPFDPSLHEAVEHVAAPDQPPGTIVAVVQAGYRVKDTVIRPAKVKVSA